MAWNLQEEEFHRIIYERMETTTWDKRIAMLNHFSNLIFSKEGEIYDEKWRTTNSNGVTRIMLWDHGRYILDNLRFSMMKEKLGLGPDRYCVVWSFAPNCASKLLLVISSLPHEKMRIYPNLRKLSGPFLHSPWTEIGEAICNRLLITKQAVQVRDNFYFPLGLL